MSLQADRRWRMHGSGRMITAQPGSISPAQILIFTHKLPHPETMALNSVAWFPMRLAWRYQIRRHS